MRRYRSFLFDVRTHANSETEELLNDTGTPTVGLCNGSLRMQGWWPARTGTSKYRTGNVNSERSQFVSLSRESSRQSG